MIGAVCLVGIAANIAAWLLVPAYAPYGEVGLFGLIAIYLACAAKGNMHERNREIERRWYNWPEDKP